MRGAGPFLLGPRLTQLVHKSLIKHSVTNFSRLKHSGCDLGFQVSDHPVGSNEGHLFH